MQLQQKLTDYSNLLFFTEKYFSLKMHHNLSISGLMLVMLTFIVLLFKLNLSFLILAVAVSAGFFIRWVYFRHKRECIRELLKNCCHIKSVECFDAMCELVNRKYLGIEPKK